MTSDRSTASQSDRNPTWAGHLEPSQRVSMRHAFDDGEEDRHTGPLVHFDHTEVSPDSSTDGAHETL